jgi:aspartate racemase
MARPFTNNFGGVSMQQVKIPGVIGGMGPQATIEFMQRIAARTGGGLEQDQLRLLVDQNPKIPNRHQAIISGNDTVSPVLLAMGRGLQAAGADFLVVPCNTAHAFVGLLTQELDIPLLSIIDCVKRLIEEDYGRVSIGLMAADGCLISEVYQKALNDTAKEVITLSGDSQAEFMTLVYRVKAGEISADLAQSVKTLFDELVDLGAEVLIAGCTEIPLMMSGSSYPLPCVDTLDVLVEATVQRAYAGVKS